MELQADYIKQKEKQNTVQGKTSNVKSLSEPKVRFWKKCCMLKINILVIGCSREC